MAITAQQVQELYIAYLGRPADKAGLDYWMAELNAEPAVLTLEDLRANFVNEQPEYANTYGGLSTAQIVAKIYENLFGREGEAEGLAYWTGEVQSGNVPVDMLLVAFLNGASEADRAVVDQKVEDAMAELPTDPTDPVEPGNPGETFAFTDGRDTLTGTSADDTFVGFVGQNQDGSIANAFATGDYVDGGAGRDKIEATLMEDQEVDSGTDSAINARTVNVEEVFIEALDLNGDDLITVDAGRMDSVQEYWSDNSSADLLITDVRLGSKLGITKDITFGLRETDFDTDFTALLDSQSFKAAPDVAQNSSLVVRIADVSTETPATPLANVSLNLNFKLGGELVSLENIRSTDGSYAGLQAAIKAALVAEGRADVTVELKTPYNEVTVAGNTVTLPFTAQEILVTDPAGNTFSDVNFTQSAIAPVADGFLVAGNATPADPTVAGNLIESNLVLDDAGRGSLAGDVVIGGMSNSNHGIEQFNVSVDRDSKIASLNTTSDKLQNIVITSEGAKGSLYLGATQANLDEIDANAFAGAELSLGEEEAIADLAFLDAGSTAADVTFDGVNDGGLAAVLNTGAGDDVITLEQTGVSQSGSTPTSVTINAGAGNNTIELSSINDAVDNTAAVTTGSGSDVITGGANSLTVNAGAGNDVIYAENTGAKTIAVVNAGAFEAAVGTTTMNASAVQEVQLLNGREVRVTLGLPGMDAVAFGAGLEVTAKVQASEGKLTTERDLYEAVAKAINEDAVLSKLAEASVDSNGDLTVQYLVDGVSDSVTPDAIIEIDVLGDWADVSAADKSALVAALKAEYHDSGITDVLVAPGYNAADDQNQIVAVVAAGSDSSTVGGTNTVTAGLGDDVVVLSSDDTKIDTLVFEAGQFGNDTVVHFNSVTVAADPLNNVDASGDVLDFTAFLNNVTSASGSTESQVRIATAVETGTGIGANEVVLADTTDLGLTAAQFEALTGAQLQTALKAANGFTVDAAAATLVGDVQKSIFMVENLFNAGEYKVFEVSAIADATNENFTAVTLVGSLDFGASLDASFNGVA
ncbi:DUF4214 domain-containing protein [Stutzerimonas kunmingensis]|uniref:DUF4214 domain-containing protein n=1 Tax=Stutzerimonas kunmingensis TaxID=1211807 RepID=UPI0028B1618D|nr:DUF4214 domain-containing protein [Stutzerimonas kunmingensis]